MAVAVWTKIDLGAEDGGLKSCYDANGLEEAYRAKLKQLGITNLRHLKGFSAKNHEEQLDKIWAEIDPDSKNFGQRGALMGTWESAMDAIRKTEEGTSAPGSASGAQAEDWEDPLPENILDKMKADWDDYYHFVIDEHLYPAATLLARVYREFQRKTPSVIQVEKLLSRIHETAPDKVLRRPITERSEVVERLPKRYCPQTVLDYHWGLLTLANAWAMVGNYEVASSHDKEKKVKFIDLSTGVNYAYSRLRIVSTVGVPFGEQLGWLQKRDLTTRKMMSILMSRDKMPAGEALEKALELTFHEWTRVKGNDVVSVHEPLSDMPCISNDGSVMNWIGGDGPRRRRSRSPARRGGGGSSGSGGKGGGQGKRYEIGSCRLHFDGRKLCGAYNGRKGCPNHKNCPQGGEHRCAYVVDSSGKVCGRQVHSYFGHEQGGGRKR